MIGSENSRDCACLNWIACLCAGAMGLNNFSFLWVKTRASIDVADEGLLRGATWKCDSRGSAILV
jgi:hypothetical protein